ncbi:uncharacterized protein [Procambarus clarkii]|uniref:uncharacterized protein isoform X1 n=1 Tax=Procambarus clarkii TaxID=6728 RepID=UPI0037440A3C
MANSPVNGSVIEAVPGNAPGSSNGCLPKNVNHVKQEPEHLGEENGIHVEDVFVNVKQEVETDMTNVCDNIAIEQNEQLERETNRENGPPLKRRTVVKGESLTLYTIRRRKRTENGDEAPELGRKLKQGSRSAVASSGTDMCILENFGVLLRQVESQTTTRFPTNKQTAHSVFFFSNCTYPLLFLRNGSTSKVPIKIISCQPV